MFELKQVIPIPLKKRNGNLDADIWGKNIRFKNKERIKIIAPSGTGKTTLIHTLYGLRKDFEGSILFDEVDIKQLSSAQIASQRQHSVSIVFQDLRLFGQLTARENIALNRVLQPPIYDVSKINEMAHLLDVSHILDQPASICSYGEQQRICIIRALVQPFKWLLMDEPFSHLDIHNQQLAIQLINDECNKRDAGFILTDLNEDHFFTYSRILHL